MLRIFDLQWYNGQDSNYAKDRRKGMNIQKLFQRIAQLTVNTLVPYKSADVQYYSQYNLKYFFKPYGKEHAGVSACGPFTCAMAASSLLKKKIDPVETMKWSVDHGYYAYKKGSYHTLIPRYAEAMGFTCVDLGHDVDELKNRLESRTSLAILLCKEKIFASGRHFVVAGIEDGYFKIYNSCGVLDCYKKFTVQQIKDALAVENVSIGPIWWITKEESVLGE